MKLIRRWCIQFESYTRRWLDLAETYQAIEDDNYELAEKLLQEREAIFGATDTELYYVRSVLNFLK